MQMRPPPVGEAVKALQIFLDHKRRTGNKVLDTEVQSALAVFEHVQRQGYKDGILKFQDEKLVSRLLHCLRPAEDTKHLGSFARLADLVHADLLAQSKATLNLAAEDDQPFFNFTYRPYLMVLARCGQGLKARAIIENQLSKGNQYFNDKNFWGPVLEAFARSRDHEEIRKTIKSMQSYGFEFNQGIQLYILKPFAEQRDMEGLKRWYEAPLDAGQPVFPAHMLVLETCLATKDFAYGNRISESLLLEKLHKVQWDVILRWAAVVGKGVDEIERLMHLMIKTGQETSVDLRPDIDTINGVVKDANERGDAYFAERLLNLADRWGMKPNAKTLMLQVEYRLKVDDLDGAKAAYQSLQTFELLAQEDVPLLNKLILKSCRIQDPDEEAIMGLVQDVQERQGSFEPETLAALCVYHLERHEFHDAIDLLNSNAFRYQSDQRAIVRDVLLSFIHDPSTSTEDAWDAYCILKETFPGELDKSMRIRIMDFFFEQGSGGTAVHVFGHMRQSLIREKRPDANTYAACFRGIAKAQDSESLDTVYNMLKLDSGVEPTTEVNNALMTAQFECGSPRRALQVWDSITFSREGPTYDSVMIALHACQFAPAGEEYVQSIWARLKKFNITVTKDLYDTYILALGACGLVSEAIATVEAMKSQTAFTPDTVT